MGLDRIFLEGEEMKLLSSKQELNECLFDIIKDSKKTLKIVSPFVDFEYKDKRNKYKWYDLIELLNKKEGILEIYTQPPTKYNKSVDSINEFTKMNENNIMTIHNLHAKMYINDNTALLSSMNLTFSSFKHSLDFGMVTENEKEYNDVLDFFKKHIYIHNKITIIEYFLAKNINAEFYYYFENTNRLFLRKNKDLVLRCYSAGYPNDNKVDVYVRPEERNAKKLFEHVHKKIFEKHNVKINWDGQGKSYCFSQEYNYPHYGIISFINTSGNQIMDILVDIFHCITSE
jgi:phosphatidylserine/phosphatidylglycerophosphate/cardiolipin synthase-like enzyme